MNYPVSYHQERLWFIDKFEAGNVYFHSPVYHNIPLTLILNGRVDEEHLTQCVEKIISRHEILRTRIIEKDNLAYQQVFEELDMPRHLEFILDSGGEHRSIHEYAVELAIIESSEPFDLSDGKLPLFRFKVYKLNEMCTIFIGIFHHLIFDKFSVLIFTNELLQLYNSKKVNSADLPALPLQYLDYANWQRNLPEILDKQLSIFWKKRLQGNLSVYDFPTDFPRAAIHKYKSKLCSLPFSAGQSARLKSYAEIAGVSIASLFLGIFNILLRKCYDRKQVVIGYASKNRQVQGTEHMIGPLSNLLVIDTEIDNDADIKETLRRIDDTLKGVLSHEIKPFDKLASELNPNKDMSRTVLFDILFSYAEIGIPSGGSQVYAEYVETNYGIGKYDLNLLVNKENDQFKAYLVYNELYFENTTIESLLNGFKNIASQILQSNILAISGLKLCNSLQESNLINVLTPNPAKYPSNATVYEVFKENVGKSLDRVALVYEDLSITYGELSKRVDEMSGFILNKTKGCNKVIGLSFEPSIDMIVSILSVLKVGCAYLSIDPQIPDKRLEYIIKDTKVEFIFCDNEPTVLQKKLLEKLAVEYFACGNGIVLNPGVNLQQNTVPVKTRKDDLIYLIYTSGSSGKPKAVGVENKNLLQLIKNENLDLKFTPSDRFSLLHTYTFDFSVWEIFGALLNGLSLVIFPKEKRVGPEEILNGLKKYGVTILNQTPTSFYNIANLETQSFKKSLFIKYVFFGGESLNVRKLSVWKAKYDNTKLINMFGITETTIHVTIKEIERKDIDKGVSNIGNGLSGTYLYILDNSMNMVPKGVAGELYVGGEGVARGYLNNPILTQERFLDDPYKKGNRIYKSGDLVKLNKNNELVYLGRKDGQVQLRGFRIELEEIENILNNYKGIEENVVICQLNNNEEPQLCSYYISKSEIKSNDLYIYLREHLPYYSIPSNFYRLTKLPLTSNGKIDKKQLSKLKIEDNNSILVSNNQLTANERLILESWNSVINYTGNDVHENFFSVGGDSIKGIQIISFLRNKGYKIAMQDIFMYPTVFTLARQIKNGQQEENVQSIIEGNAPLTPIQYEFLLNNSNNSEINHFNHAFQLRFKERPDKSILTSILLKLVLHHDALRTSFKKEGEKTVQKFMSGGFVEEILEIDLTDSGNCEEELIDNLNKLHRSFDIYKSPLFKFVLFRLKEEDSLFIIAHHLIIDGISWRIILDDFSKLYKAAKDRTEIELPSKTTSFKEWAIQLEKYINSENYSEEIQFWKSIETKKIDLLTNSAQQIPNSYLVINTLNLEIGKQLTNSFKNSHIKLDLIFLSAICKTFIDGFSFNNISLHIEKHGREKAIKGSDITRTVGWFTNTFPIVFDFNGYPKDTGEIFKTIDGHMSKIPEYGFNYLPLKYMYSGVDNSCSRFCFTPEILYNNLGEFQNENDEDYRIVYGNNGLPIADSIKCPYKIIFTISLIEERIKLRVQYNSKCFTEDKIKLLEKYLGESFKSIATFLDSNSFAKETVVQSGCKLRNATIPVELSSKFDIEDVFPLGPMQLGILSHILLKDPKAYVNVVKYTFEGDLDIKLLEASLNKLIIRHQVLRSIFFYEGNDTPVQVVLKERSTKIETLEDPEGNGGKIYVNNYIDNLKQKGFDICNDVLFQLTIFKVTKKEYIFVWCFHHLIMDGWSMGIIYKELFQIYYSKQFQVDNKLTLPTNYRNYIDWIYSKEKQDAFDFWKSYLESYQMPTGLPKRAEFLPSDDYVRQRFNLSEDLSDKIIKIGKDNSVTISVLLQCIWGLILGKLNSTDDVLFCRLESGRNPEIEHVDNIVGLLINIVPLRIKIRDDERFSQFIKRIQDEIAVCYNFNNLSISEIIKLGELGADLFDHDFVYENYPINTEFDKPNSDLGNHKIQHKIKNSESTENSVQALGIIVENMNFISFEFRYNNKFYELSVFQSVFENICTMSSSIANNPDIKSSELLDSIYFAELMTNDHLNLINEEFGKVF